MTAAEVIAVIFTVVVSTFLGFSVALLIIARGDRLAAERSHDAEAAVIVEGRERRTVVSILGWGAMVFVGIVLILPIERSATTLVTTIGLLGGVVLLGVKDVVELVDRLSFPRAPRAD